MRTPVSILQRWVRYRRKVDSAHRLDDRMLRDIGLVRSEVSFAAERTAQRHTIALG